MGSGTTAARSFLPPPVAALLGQDRPERARRGLLAGRNRAGLGAICASGGRTGGRRRAVGGRLRRAGAFGRRRAGRIRALEGLPSLPATAFRASAPVSAARNWPLEGSEGSDRAQSGVGSGDSGRFRALRGRVRRSLLPIGGRCPLAGVSQAGRHAHGSARRRASCSDDAQPGL